VVSVLYTLHVIGARLLTGIQVAQQQMNYAQGRRRCRMRTCDFLAPVKANPLPNDMKLSANDYFGEIPIHIPHLWARSSNVPEMVLIGWLYGMFTDW
jgi:hypothetical protein